MLFDASEIADSVDVAMYVLLILLEFLGELHRGLRRHAFAGHRYAAVLWKNRIAASLAPVFHQRDICVRRRCCFANIFHSIFLLMLSFKLNRVFLRILEIASIEGFE